MAINSFAVAVVTLLCLLTQVYQGYGLKCHSFSCSGASWSGLKCTTQQEMVCPAGNYSCLYQRLSVQQKDGSRQHAESGSCSTTAKCNMQANEFCKKLSTAAQNVQDCKLQCCQKGLCNARQAAPTTKPPSIAGGGVTCYFCDSLTINGVLNKTNCDKPKKLKCNEKQDRCITVQMTLVNQVGKLEPLLRTCASEKYCNNVCKDSNETEGGQFTSCDKKCCFGDLCNIEPTGGGSLAGTNTSVLFAFVALIFYVY